MLCSRDWLIEVTMQQQNRTEANILGYRLDRIDDAHARSPRYEVRGPEDGSVIASFPDRPAAERYIVTRELDSIRLRRGTPAY